MRALKFLMKAELATGYLSFFISLFSTKPPKSQDLSLWLARLMTVITGKAGLGD